MNETNWSNKLGAAASEGEVTILVRSYMAQLPDSDFQALPTQCRPVHLIDGDDVTAWAYKLASSHCKMLDTEDVHMLCVLERLTAVFAQASRRLASLACHYSMVGSRERPASRA